MMWFTWVMEGEEGWKGVPVIVGYMGIGVKKLTRGRAVVQYKRLEGLSEVRGEWKFSRWLQFTGVEARRIYGVGGIQGRGEEEWSWE